MPKPLYWPSKLNVEEFGLMTLMQRAKLLRADHVLLVFIISYINCLLSCAFVPYEHPK